MDYFCVQCQGVANIQIIFSVQKDNDVDFVKHLSQTVHFSGSAFYFLLLYAFLDEHLFQLSDEHNGDASLNTAEIFPPTSLWYVQHLSHCWTSTWDYWGLFLLQLFSIPIHSIPQLIFFKFSIDIIYHGTSLYNY